MALPAISDRALSAMRVLLRTPNGRQNPTQLAPRLFSSHAQADAMLRRQLGWSWQPWHLYPSADLARLEAALHAGRGYARRLAKVAVKAGQLGLPGVH